jgi:protein-S-isoprenylcysteine O-methyltransferase Ste14
MLAAYVLLVFSVLLGGVSLLVFGLVLAFGPFEIVPLGLGTGAALAWDGGLSLVFFLQHSVMVRRSFRAWLGRRLPAHAHAAVYSVASGVALLLLVTLWQRTDVVLLTVEGTGRWVLRGLFFVAGFVFLWAVRALGAFDTFGVEPIKAHLRGAEPPSLPFAVGGPYRWVRHPLYSLLLVLLWSSPDLTADRLLFNGLFTAWIVVGARLEERDLVTEFGERYRAYQQVVPMLVPWKIPAGRLEGVDP